VSENTLEQDAERLVEAKRQFDDALEALARNLGVGPQNPRIQPLGEGRAFAIRSSHLAGNWSPQYHEFTNQYAYLADLVRKMAKGQPGANAETIATLIERGQHQQKRFHPDVIAGCKSRLDIVMRAFVRMIPAPEPQRHTARP
jgi:hypothetical protein